MHTEHLLGAIGVTLVLTGVGLTSIRYLTSNEILRLRLIIAEIPLFLAAAGALAFGPNKASALIFFIFGCLAANQLPARRAAARDYPRQLLAETDALALKHGLPTVLPVTTTDAEKTGR